MSIKELINKYRDNIVINCRLTNDDYELMRLRNHIKLVGVECSPKAKMARMKIEERVLLE